MTVESRVYGWRRWMLGGYAVVVAVLVVAWAYSIIVPIADFVEKRTREGMAAVANATTVALQSSDLPATDVLKRIAATDGLRLTLIASDGTVLAESIQDDADMQNHAGRPEVVSALAGEIGYDRRVSKTDGVEYQYVAISGTYQGNLVVVRVSRTMEQASTLKASYLRMSLGLLAGALVVATAVAWIAFKRADDPMRRLEIVRTDFVANASHELKTPVAGIRLLADSIGQASDDGDLHIINALSERLKDESIRLQSLVGDLMDLSRLEDRDRVPTASTMCDLGAIVVTSVETHRARAEASGLLLTLHDSLLPGTHVAISATDATLVCDNLVSNALAYTERGSVDISLTPDGDHVVLKVSDTGIGISYADQERVFERFYRVDMARSRESGGTGLGLSLVRHAVERAHGTVELASEPGEGSTFTVRFWLVGARTRCSTRTC
jgi:signal transduction histidine kinase